MCFLRLISDRSKRGIWRNLSRIAVWGDCLNLWSTMPKNRTHLRTPPRNTSISYSLGFHCRWPANFLEVRKRPRACACCRPYKTSACWKGGATVGRPWYPCFPAAPRWSFFRCRRTASLTEECSILRAEWPTSGNSPGVLQRSPLQNACNLLPHRSKSRSAKLKHPWRCEYRPLSSSVRACCRGGLIVRRNVDRFDKCCPSPHASRFLSTQQRHPSFIAEAHFWGPIISPYKLESMPSNRENGSRDKPQRPSIPQARQPTPWVPLCLFAIRDEKRRLAGCWVGAIHRQHCGAPPGRSTYWWFPSGSRPLASSTKCHPCEVAMRKNAKT